MFEGVEVGIEEIPMEIMEDNASMLGRYTALIL